LNDVANIELMDLGLLNLREDRLVIIGQNGDEVGYWSRVVVLSKAYGCSDRQKPLVLI